jgi:hypothetical protein
MEPAGRQARWQAAEGRSTSRRSDGFPGDIGALPVNSFIHPPDLPINTSTIKVLQQPVEPSQAPIRSETERKKEPAEAGSLTNVQHRGIDARLSSSITVPQAKATDLVG